MTLATYLHPRNSQRRPHLSTGLNLTSSSGTHPVFRLTESRSVGMTQTHPVDIRTFELLPDIGHLLVDSFLLKLTNSGTTNVRNELGRTAVSAIESG